MINNSRDKGESSTIELYNKVYKDVNDVYGTKVKLETLAYIQAKCQMLYQHIVERRTKNGQ